MRKQLAKKQIVVKIAAYAESVTGMVYEVEEDGVWIQPSTKIAALPANLKFPLLFVPFCQMEWLAVSMTPEQLTGH